MKEILAKSILVTKELGSSTVVAAKLQEDKLKTTNLGDSGYALYSVDKNGIDPS